MDEELKTQYELVRASDVIHDGMWMQLYDRTQADTQEIAAVFFSDEDRTFTFHCQNAVLPLEAVEYLITAAKEGLPPRTTS